jgi:hypothetical protein
LGEVSHALLVLLVDAFEAGTGAEGCGGLVVGVEVGVEAGVGVVGRLFELE